jgi:GT2 family glycosyltransferase
MNRRRQTPAARLEWHPGQAFYRTEWTAGDPAHRLAGGVPRAAEHDVEISVVIPAYFGERTIADCLRSVLQATAERRCEVIVVESSGDGTAAIVRDQFPGVVLIASAERLSAGAARNRGAAAARGRFVFFTDQDCVVPPDWISRLEGHLLDASVGAAGGSVGIRNPSNLSGCAVYFLEFLRHFPSGRQPRRDDNFLVGCNSVYRVEALQAVRFPDLTLGEDVIFSHALQGAGFGVVYDPRIEVRHYNREGWAQFFEYNRKMGSSAAVYHGVVQRWWARPFFQVPLLAYLAPAAVLPSIAFDLLRSRPAYFVRFLTVLPMCLAGNLVWAHAFRQQILQTRRGRPSPGEPRD